MFICGHDERLQLVDRSSAGPDRRCSRDGVNPDGISDSVVGAGLVELVTAQRFASSADRVEGVGLGTVLGCFAHRSVELDDEFVETLQRHGEPAAVARGALDQPGSFGLLGVSVGPRNGILVTVAGGWEAVGGDHPRRS